VRGQLLFGEKKWAEAEPLIRQCLAIRKNLSVDYGGNVAWV
jgi:hypothetical protein